MPNLDDPYDCTLTIFTLRTLMKHLVREPCTTPTSPCKRPSESNKNVIFVSFFVAYPAIHV